MVQNADFCIGSTPFPDTLTNTEAIIQRKDSRFIQKRENCTTMGIII
jgi:hypothetical protein